MRSVVVTPEGKARLETLRPKLRRGERGSLRALSRSEQLQKLQLVATIQSDLPDE